MWPAKPRFNLKKRLVAIKRRRKVETFLSASLLNCQQEKRLQWPEQKSDESSSGNKFNCGEFELKNR